jgi:carboxymethylenebutenolidase
MHVYEADHAFVNDQRPTVYEPASAALAWERTVRFLRETLGAPATAAARS